MRLNDPAKAVLVTSARPRSPFRFQSVPNQRRPSTAPPVYSKEVARFPVAHPGGSKFSEMQQCVVGSVRAPPPQTTLALRAPACSCRGGAVTRKASLSGTAVLLHREVHFERHAHCASPRGLSQLLSAATDKFGNGGLIQAPREI